MVPSVSAVLLLAVAAAILYRSAGLRAWQAAVCVLFGFYLASSPLAPAISAAARQLAALMANR